LEVDPAARDAEDAATLLDGFFSTTSAKASQPVVAMAQKISYLSSEAISGSSSSGAEVIVRGWAGIE
jgi:hypothetical protein